jgi:ribosome modulation factor
MPAIEKSIRDIYREGLFARALGRGAECNPYPVDSKERDSWLEGWGLIDESNDNSSLKGDVGEE